MSRVEAAFTGVAARDAELRVAKSGRQWLGVPVLVGDEPDQQWIQVAAFSGDIEELSESLKRGVEMYVEGTLKLRMWDGPDGPRAGLNVVASVIQPHGLIGRKRPKKPRSNGTGKTKTDPNAPLPFDDQLPF